MPRRSLKPVKAKSPCDDFAGSRRTLPFDRVIPGVGRIRVRSGTTDPKLFEKLNRMLTWLATRRRPRLLILKAIQAGHVAPLEVRKAIRQDRLPELQAQLRQRSRQIEEAWLTWMVVGVSGSTVTERTGALGRLRSHAKGPLTYDNLDAAVRAYKLEAKGLEIPAMFNRVRHAALAFVRDTVGSHTPEYARLLAIKELREVKERRYAPNPAQAIQIRDALGHGAAARMWWIMYLTGMGPHEYCGAWQIEEDHVHIHGTKAAPRIRDVPKVLGGLQPARMHYKTFATALAKVAKERGWDVQPYDARRGYKLLLQRAGLAEMVIDDYMGHSIEGKVGPRYGHEEPELAWVRHAKAIMAQLELAEAEVRAGSVPSPRRARRTVERRDGTDKSPQKSPRAGKSTRTRDAVKP